MQNRFSSPISSRYSEKRWDTTDSENKVFVVDIEILEEYRHVFFAAPDYVAFSRVENGMYIDVNPGFERLTGYKRADAVGHTSLELGIWPDKESRARFVEALHKTGSLHDYPALFRIRSGELRHVEISGNTMRLKGDEVMVTVIRDVTERISNEEELNQYRKRLLHLVEQRTNELQDANEELRDTNRKLEEAHNQLLQSEKMASIGQLAAGVAHEINNPISFVNSNLSSLEGYLQGILEMLAAYEANEHLLAENHPAQLKTLQAVKEKVELDYLKEDIVSLLNESKDGLLRVKKIVQDLKDFSHVGTAEWQTVDLHAGLDSTLNIVNNEIKYKAKVIKQYGQIPPIECLPLELNQVFMNMLVNAAHAIADHGEITVRTSIQGDQVLVEIADNGDGISPENLKRIFDPFFTTKPVGKGTGLGLSLSYSIVQKHQGKIEVESAVGKGTCFKIWLPVQHDYAASGGESAGSGI
ncbi:MAG: PAS domain S-box protein [Burkholderiales bacterium]|nr:PAS domain S-box protein [Burkholderiales bacterium]